MISSPSLFQTLATTPGKTPKLQRFEWTIDELSSLNPMHLTPHETQFCEDLDPIREAQAQAAINAFFQEQEIGKRFNQITWAYHLFETIFILVPSPRECTLRNQKIVFKSEAIAFTIVNSNGSQNCSRSEEERQATIEKKEAASQTLFTFPPKLPKEVEDVLRKYQLLNDENDETENYETETLDLTTQSNRSMMDVSTLRRKLFINRPTTPNDFVPDELYNVDLSPAPRTPELTNKSCDRPATNGSFGSEFGELSPISPINMSSNDVSMMSECGNDRTPRGFGCKKMKKKGKNLSESFCLLQHSEEFKDHHDSIEAPKRFDSGFPTDEDSKLSFMQF